MYSNDKRKKPTVVRPTYIISSTPKKREPRKSSGGCGCGNKTKRIDD